jgi:hypothetical protein
VKVSRINSDFCEYMRRFLSSLSLLKREKKSAILGLTSLLIFALWGMLALISVGQLLQSVNGFDIKTSTFGALGWLTLFSSIALLARKSAKIVLLVFLTFFSLGYFIGPYLEPPSDPLGHLIKTNQFCEKRISQVSNRNSGLLHYSMSASILCSENPAKSQRSRLIRINFLHGLYWGGIFAVLFLVAISAGLSGKWALLSCLIAFLFLGTNRFSYFSYYSFAPSFTSILVYWLWIAAFFFKRKLRFILIGSTFAILCLPVLVANHLQEAVFVAAIVAVWLFLNFHNWIWENVNSRNPISIERKDGISKESPVKILFLWLRLFYRKKIKILYLGLIFGLLFILPQIREFQLFLSSWFPRAWWRYNGDLIFSISGFHIMGKIWTYRIHDTLGLVGFLPVLLVVLYLGLKQMPKNDIKNRAYILGLIPLMGYCIPFFNFIWASNTKVPEYYRLSYSTLFWIPIAWFMCDCERYCLSGLRKIKSILPAQELGLFKNFSFRALYFTCCLIGIVAVSSVRSGPVYGKLDFLLLEGRPWLAEWKPMIRSVIGRNEKTILTDSVTSTVFSSVFDLPSTGNRDLVMKRLNIKDMNKKNANGTYHCIINLRGFSPSWVPSETGHWYTGLARTSLQYQYEEVPEEKLQGFLRKNPPRNCDVFF